MSAPATHATLIGDLAGILDVPIPYISRVRSYYQGLGYGAPYEWARPKAEPQLVRLAKPLSQCRVAIVTTAAPVAADKALVAGRQTYDASIKFYDVRALSTAEPPSLRNNHVAIDWDHTTSGDERTFFPLHALRYYSAKGRIGSVAPRFIAVPTNRSQRVTTMDYAPEVVRIARADAVDVALLVPNCPVCHQSMALVARQLEEAGIATVVMGCARDIVEYVGVPRLLFSDFPLGNPCGRPAGTRPGDELSQIETVEFALGLIEGASLPRTTVQSPLRWSEDIAWKLGYSNITRLSADEIARRRAEFDAVKSVAKEVKASAPS